MADNSPENAERREAVIRLYSAGAPYEEIARRTGYQARSLTKILARARAAGDERARLRGATPTARAKAKVRTVRWAQSRGQMASARRIDGLSDYTTGGVDADWDSM